MSFWNSFLGMVVEGRHSSRMHSHLMLKCDFVPVYTIILEDSKNGCLKTQWFWTSQRFQTWRSRTATPAPSAVQGFTSEFPPVCSHYLPWHLSLPGVIDRIRIAGNSPAVCRISQRMYPLLKWTLNLEQHSVNIIN